MPQDKIKTRMKSWLENKSRLENKQLHTMTTMTMMTTMTTMTMTMLGDSNPGGTTTTEYDRKARIREEETNS